ncbi:MAG: hypothetical protein V1739_07985 [Candidatus Omnitrophota bacterium]
MDREKIDRIKGRFDKIYNEYADSDKKEFAKYWEEMDKLTEAYFKEKFGEQ